MKNIIAFSRLPFAALLSALKSLSLVPLNLEVFPVPRLQESALQVTVSQILAQSRKTLLPANWKIMLAGIERKMSTSKKKPVIKI